MTLYQGDDAVSLALLGFDTWELIFLQLQLNMLLRKAFSTNV